MKKVKLVLWILIAVMLLSLIGLNVYNIYLAKTEKVVHPELTFEIENYGNVKMELYPEYAPNTVANIIKLAEKGYYNNKIIHGKDEICLYLGKNEEGEVDAPKASFISEAIEADSESDYEYAVPGEFFVNGYEYNTLHHEKGVVSLMRSDYTQYFQDLTNESYNSGHSQIGIIMDTAPALNGVYAGFGKITEGLDIIEKIYNEEKIKVEEKKEGEEVAEEALKTFEKAPVIKSVTVNTFENDYGNPIILKAFDYNAYVNEFLTQYYQNSAE